LRRGDPMCGAFRDSAVDRKALASRLSSTGPERADQSHACSRQIESPLPVGCGERAGFPGERAFSANKRWRVIVKSRAARRRSSPIEAFEMTPRLLGFCDTKGAKKALRLFGLFPATDEQTLIALSAAWRKRIGTVSVT